jgi:hypothetical protein
VAKTGFVREYVRIVRDALVNGATSVSSMSRLANNQYGHRLAALIDQYMRRSALSSQVNKPSEFNVSLVSVI